jgi:hypothetical protein
MINEQDILNHMKGMGKSVNNIFDACSSSEGMLSELMANRENMPEGMLDQLDESLKEIRLGKSKLKGELSNIEKIFSQNGGNGSK